MKRALAFTLFMLSGYFSALNMPLEWFIVTTCMDAGALALLVLHRDRR